MLICSFSTSDRLCVPPPKPDSKSDVTAAGLGLEHQAGQPRVWIPASVLRLRSRQGQQSGLRGELTTGVNQAGEDPASLSEPAPRRQLAGSAPGTFCTVSLRREGGEVLSLPPRDCLARWGGICPAGSVKLPCQITPAPIKTIKEE